MVFLIVFSSKKTKALLEIFFEEFFVKIYIFGKIKFGTVWSNKMSTWSTRPEKCHAMLDSRELKMMENLRLGD